MMDGLWSLQSMITALLGVAALGCEIFALVDCLRTRPDAFVAAGKRSKNFWLVLTGIATLIGIVFVQSVFNLFGLAAFVVAAIYLADVRPALRAVLGKGRRGDGPYGPW